MTLWTMAPVHGQRRARVCFSWVNSLSARFGVASILVLMCGAPILAGADAVRAQSPAGAVSTQTGDIGPLARRGNGSAEYDLGVRPAHGHKEIYIPSMAERDDDRDEQRLLNVSHFTSAKVPGGETFVVDDTVRRIFDRHIAEHPEGFIYEQLQQVADEVSALYRRRGLAIAHAFIPMQSVNGGVVDVGLVVARLGRVFVDKSMAIEPASMAQVVDAFDPLRGTPMRISAIEKVLEELTLRYASKRPTLVFAPGKIVGESDLLLIGSSDAEKLRVSGYGVAMPYDQCIHFQGCAPNLSIGELADIGTCRERVKSKGCWWIEGYKAELNIYQSISGMEEYAGVDKWNVNALGDSGIRTRTAHAELPAYPWPPERPTSRFNLIRADTLFAALSFVEVEQHLRHALAQADYYEMTVYQAPGGFVLATRLEAIDTQGKPLEGTHRYRLPKPEAEFTLSEYLKSLFFAPAGFYRFIIFVITDSPYQTSHEALGEDSASARLHGGASRLPSAYKNLHYSADHRTDALIYEFRVRREGTENVVEPVIQGGLPPQDHFRHSGLSAAPFFAQQQ